MAHPQSTFIIRLSSDSFAVRYSVGFWYLHIAHFPKHLSSNGYRATRPRLDIKHGSGIKHRACHAHLHFCHVRSFRFSPLTPSESRFTPREKFSHHTTSKHITLFNSASTIMSLNYDDDPIDEDVGSGAENNVQTETLNASSASNGEIYHNAHFSRSDQHRYRDNDSQHDKQCISRRLLHGPAWCLAERASNANNARQRTSPQQQHG